MAQIILLTDVTSLGYGKYGGTYKIATEIRKHNYTCQVIDNYRFIGKDRIKLLLDKFVNDDTVLIGFSCTLTTTRESKYFALDVNDIVEIINYAKQINRNIKICLGGSKVDLTLNLPFIDYAVIGKADNAIIALLEHLTHNKELTHTTNKFTKIVKGDDYFYTQSQFAESQIIYQHNDIILPNEVLPIEIARGCIFQCAFCRYDLIGKRIGDWTKTKTALVEEFTRNYEMFGVTNYMFTDELVNESVGKLEMLAEVSASLPFKINYTAYARVDLIGRFPEMISLLHESGARSLSFGVETLNYETGKIIGKGLNPDKVKQTLADCKTAWGTDVMISANFIVGLPKETEESIWKTVEYILQEDCPIDIFMFHSLGITNNVIYRSKSKIEIDPKKYGYKLNPLSSLESWESENLNSNESEQLVKRIYNDSRVKEKIKLRSASFLGRVLALGYSVEDLFGIMKDSELTKKFHEEMNVRAEEMKKEYYRQLLNI